MSRIRQFAPPVFALLLIVAGQSLEAHDARRPAPSSTSRPVYVPRPAPTPVVVRRMVPCAFEDGSGSALPCYWDASTRGNRTGRSFWFDSTRTIHYYG